MRKQGQVRHKKRGGGEVTTHKLERAEKGQVRTWKESKKSGCTYSLKSVGQRISQDMERRGVRKGNSLPGECVGRIKSLQERKKVSERGELTNWRV